MWCDGGEGREQPAWTSGGLGGRQGTPREPHPHGCTISRDSNTSLLSSYALGTRSLTCYTVRLEKRTQTMNIVFTRSENKCGLYMNVILNVFLLRQWLGFLKVHSGCYAASRPYEAGKCEGPLTRHRSGLDWCLSLEIESRRVLCAVFWGGGGGWTLLLLTVWNMRKKTCSLGLLRALGANPVDEVWWIPVTNPRERQAEDHKFKVIFGFLTSSSQPELHETLWGRRLCIHVCVSVYFFLKKLSI